MIVVKFIILIVIAMLASYIGVLISNKYKNRVIELKEIKRALNIFATKIKYTYEPVPDIFLEISGNMSSNIGQIFKNASKKMENATAKQAWTEGINESKNNLTKEDKEVIKGLGKLLGKTDIEGQVSQIELTDKFLDAQIEKAVKEYEKNEKLYKTLRSSFRTCSSNSSYIEVFKRKGEKSMDINLLFKIAAIGILVAVLHQVLVRAGREDQAMMTTLAGLVIVLTMVIKEISTLFDSVRTLFNL